MGNIGWLRSSPWKELALRCHKSWCWRARALLGRRVKWSLRLSFRLAMLCFCVIRANRRKGIAISNGMLPARLQFAEGHALISQAATGYVFLNGFLDLARVETIVVDLTRGQCLGKAISLPKFDALGLSTEGTHCQLNGGQAR